MAPVREGQRLIFDILTSGPTRRRMMLCAIAFGALLARPTHAVEWAPVNWSGSVGYNFRLLDGSQGQRSLSRQLLGSVHGNTYIYRPWFATTDGSFTLSLDDSASTDPDPGDGTTYNQTDSSILTGVFNLNVLPQSRSPFYMRYSVSDTRVDNTALDSDAFIILGDADSKTHKLAMRQSYLFDGGHRAYATYDNNRWSSERSGYYSDEAGGVELDVKGKNQRLTANGRVQRASRSVSSEENNSNLVDVTHYFTPNRDFRIDTRANVYAIEREFQVPSSNTQSGTGTTDISQASSFIFYRPANSRWSLSGGVRLFDMSGENDGLKNDSQNLSLTGGGFYQYNKRLRFDGSAAYSTIDSNNIESDVTRQHGGVLYQSDLILWRGFTYNWFGTGTVDNVDDTTTDAFQTYAGGVSHTIARSWAQESGHIYRISGSQSLTESYFTEFEDQQTRLDHTVSAGWNRNVGGAASYVRLTISDRRGFGWDEGDQQFYNFQANRTQQITRRSSLTGNLTVQHVEQDFTRVKQDSSVTTTTGRVDYRDSAIFGVPKLGFMSSVLGSIASDEQGLDRVEWENRLDYHIGQLTSNLSVRYIDYEDLDYWLTFFRIERHF